MEEEKKHGQPFQVDLFEVGHVGHIGVIQSRVATTSQNDLREILRVRRLRRLHYQIDDAFEEAGWRRSHAGMCKDRRDSNQWITKELTRFKVEADGGQMNLSCDLLVELQTLV